MDERSTEQMLLDIEEKLDRRFDDLERRVERLEGRSRAHSANIDTLTEILDRLTRDDRAVLGRRDGEIRIDRGAAYRAFERDGEIRIDRGAAYRAFERAGIPRATALRALADSGRIRLQYDAPHTRRFTPKVRVGPELVRCVVVLCREVRP